MFLLIALLLTTPTTKRVHHVTGHGESYVWEYLHPNKVQDCAVMRHTPDGWAYYFEEESGKRSTTYTDTRANAEMTVENKCPSISKEWRNGAE